MGKAWGRKRMKIIWFIHYPFQKWNFHVFQNIWWYIWKRGWIIFLVCGNEGEKATSLYVWLYICDETILLFSDVWRRGSWKTFKFKLENGYSCLYLCMKERRQNGSFLIQYIHGALYIYVYMYMCVCDEAPSANVDIICFIIVPTNILLLLPEAWLFCVSGGGWGGLPIPSVCGGGPWRALRTTSPYLWWVAV